MEQELLTLQGHLSSPEFTPGFYSIFSFICMFCSSLFVRLSFLFLPSCCLFFDLRILITPLVPSNSSCTNILCLGLFEIPKYLAWVVQRDREHKLYAKIRRHLIKFIDEITKYLFKRTEGLAQHIYAKIRDVLIKFINEITKNLTPGAQVDRERNIICQYSRCLD